MSRKCIFRGVCPHYYNIARGVGSSQFITILHKAKRVDWNFSRRLGFAMIFCVRPTSSGQIWLQQGNCQAWFLELKTLYRTRIAEIIAECLIFKFWIFLCLCIGFFSANVFLVNYFRTRLRFKEPSLKFLFWWNRAIIKNFPRF